MINLLEKLEQFFKDLDDQLMQVDVDQFNAGDVEDFMKTAAEAINLIEKNTSDLESAGDAVGIVENLDKLKFAAVCMHKALPHLQAADEILSGVSYEIADTITDLVGIVDKSLQQVP